MEQTLVTVEYKPVNGKRISVEVSPEVKEALEETDRKLRSQGRQDRRHLDLREYIDGVSDTTDIYPQEDIADLVVMTDAQMTLRQDEAGGGICPSRIIEKDYGQVLTPIDRIRHELFACEEFAVEDSSAGKMTGELLQKSTSIATIISDARVKYIVGEIDEAGFLAAVQAWKDAGGKDIIDSLNA